jgi:hypothetical protein
MYWMAYRIQTKIYRYLAVSGVQFWHCVTDTDQRIQACNLFQVVIGLMAALDNPYKVYKHICRRPYIDTKPSTHRLQKMFM